MLHIGSICDCLQLSNRRGAYLLLWVSIQQQRGGKLFIYPLGMSCGYLKKRVLVSCTELSARPWVNRAIYLLLTADHCGTCSPLIKWRYSSIFLLSVLRAALSA